MTVTSWHKKRSPIARHRVAFRPRLEALEDRQAPAVHTWTGAVNNLWSSAGNWTGGAPTESGAELIFPGTGAISFNTQNDLTGVRLSRITFEAGGYSIKG